MSWEREMDAAIEAHAGKCPPLLTGDVILTRSATLLGKVIRLAERRHNDPVVYNHVGLVVESGMVGPTQPPGPSARMVEALWHVRAGTVWNLYGPSAGEKRPTVAIYRPLNISPRRRSHIAFSAERYVGRRYGWWKLLGNAGDSLLSALTFGRKDVRLFRRLNFIKGRPICSYLVAGAFSLSGYDFGVPANTATPDDIHDFVSTHPEKYALVFEGRIE